MKILIVDDHAYNRDLLRFILEDQGHQCVEADSGLGAIRAFEEDPRIDLLLMDINMPLMDGIEVTRQICQLKGERDVIIIFVTALDNADVLVRCLDAGGDDFVPKPINEPVLLSKVNAHGRNQETLRRLKSAHAQLQFHQQNVEREHAVIEKVFSKSRQRNSTRCLNVEAYTSPVSMFNGDLVLCAPSPSGGEYVIIGDFTGHGLPAAIGSLPVMNIFYDMAERHAGVGEIAREINRQLHNVLPVGMFFCAAILHLDESGRSGKLWCGGMSDAIVLEPDGQGYRMLAGHHMPLGILGELEFDNTVQSFGFADGARLYIYTDGINEAKNADGQEYGEQRVLNTLRRAGGDRVNALINDVKHFSRERQRDDVSVVEVLCSECVHLDARTGARVSIPPQTVTAKPVPWHWAVTLTGADLRKALPVEEVAAMFCTLAATEQHRSSLCAVVTELYNNALEHGVLRLDSALKQTAQGFTEYYQLREKMLESVGSEAITVEIAIVEDGRLRVRVSDSGPGFDYSATRSSLAENVSGYGRGLRLVASLCAELEFSNSGRTATAYLDLT